jgi:hypothetical protein
MRGESTVAELLLVGKEERGRRRQHSTEVSTLFLQKPRDGKEVVK